MEAAGPGHLSRLISGVIPIQATRTRTPTIQEAIISGCTRNVIAIRVTAQIEAHPQVYAIIRRAQDQLARNNGHLGWSITSYLPGRNLDMNPSGTHNVNCYNIHISGRDSAAFSTALLEALAAIEGSTGPGNAVFAWGPDDWHEAVFVPIHYGYIPVVIEALQPPLRSP
jgi:hypothetical protein